MKDLDMVLPSHRNLFVVMSETDIYWEGCPQYAHNKKESRLYIVYDRTKYILLKIVSE